MAAMPVKLMVTGSRNCSLLAHSPPPSATVLPLSSTFNVSLPLPVMLMMPWTLSSTLPVLVALPKVVLASAGLVSVTMADCARLPMLMMFVPPPVFRFSVVIAGLPRM